jgi:hypothetical protein
MRRLAALLALPLLSATSACTASQAESPASRPASVPMASFARMVGGEWRMTMTSGEKQYTVWYWGPGRRSLRAITHGHDGGGNPWRDLSVVYWHPGLGQVREIGLNPFAQSASESTFRLDGKDSEAFTDLYQNGAHRKLASRTTFDGPDRYRAVLMEQIEGSGVTTLAEWEYERLQTLTRPSRRRRRRNGSPSGG